MKPGDFEEPLLLRRGILETNLPPGLEILPTEASWNDLEGEMVLKLLTIGAAVMIRGIIISTEEFLDSPDGFSGTSSGVGRSYSRENSSIDSLIISFVGEILSK